MKVFLGPSGPSSGDYVRLLQRTLAEVMPPPAEGDAQGIRLKMGLAAIAGRITEQASLEEITQAVGAATDLLRKHHSGEAQKAAQKLTELKGVMRTMTDTITFLSESRSTVVHQLTFVERQLEDATELEDIRLLRPRVAECLELVRQETARLQAESTAHSEAVRQKMGMPALTPEKALGQRLGSLDVATGLPNRAAAERLIEDKMVSGLRCSMALFMPKRLAFVTQRHGREAEDQVLLHVAQHLTKLLPQGAYLYRWTGPSLLAVRVSTNSPENDEQVWRQIAAKPFEKTIENERRSALLRITLACMVSQTRVGTALEPIMDEMDEFVAKNSRD